MIGSTLSHYRILDELGRGGMGIVYKAEDTKLDRIVAIKVLPAAALSSKDDRARFYREAKAAAQLHHAHIASVFEIDEAVPERATSEDLRPFISMEYIEGETLAERIEKGPLKLEEAVRIASQIASGLEAAHEKEIVHRDLKSQNVMLTSKGEAKILDFGLAQTAASTKLTRMGSTLGTVAYMSPEQAQGAAVDNRTDIWSLGVVLYEMIAGRSPFPGEYDKAVIYGILNQDPEPLTALRTGVPMGLEWIVNKCLAKRAEDRYQDATDLLVDLRNESLTTSGISSVSAAESLLSSQITLPSVSTRTTIIRSTASKKAWIAASAAMVVALVLGYLLGMSRSGSETSHVRRTIPVRLDGYANVRYPTISRDSNYIAFSGTDTLAHAGIFLYETQTGEIAFLDGTDGGEYSKFSPDGQWLAYTSNGRVFRISIPAGVPEDVGTNAWTLTWLDNDRLTYSSRLTIYLMDFTSGDTRVLYQPDSTFGTLNAVALWHTDHDNQVSYGSVEYIPKGGSILTASPISYSLKDGIRVSSQTGVFNPYPTLNGFLLYQVDSQVGSLIARPWDSRSMAFLGPPTEISDVAHWQNFSVGPDGSLLVANLGQSVSTEEIYLVSLADSSIQHIPTNFSGSAQPLLPSFSPNGERIVLEYDQQNGGSKFIASVDLEREFATRLTSGGDYEDPDWSFDGSSVYYSDPSGKIYRRSADGSGAQEDISVNGMQVTTSPRGNTLSYIQRGFDRTHEVLLAYDLDAAEESVIDSTNSLKSRPTFSPDGQYIAFTHFPEAGIGARSIIDGVYQPLTELVGVRPIWSADGEYVYFGIHNNGIYRIPVSNESRLQVNGPPTKILSLVGSVSFDVDSTGDRLIVVASNVDFTRPNDQYSSTLLWKQNWAQSLSDK